MAKTSYYTVNGQIIGERTAGVRRNYGADALGSVTSTVQGSAIENTYAYKPYGGQLLVTGSGADPRFKWVGTQGYLPSQRTNGEYYVRARCYSSLTARWLTRDPLFYAVGSAITGKTYGYASQSPTSRSDASGLFDYSNILWPMAITPGCVGGPFAGGGNSWLTLFSEYGDDPLLDPLWFVQRVVQTSMLSIYSRSGTPESVNHSEVCHWEAWPMRSKYVGVFYGKQVYETWDPWGGCWDKGGSGAEYLKDLKNRQRKDYSGEIHLRSQFWFTPRSSVWAHNCESSTYDSIPGDDLAPVVGRYCSCNKGSISGMLGTTHTREMVYTFDTRPGKTKALWNLSIDGQRVKGEKAPAKTSDLQFKRT